MDSPYWGVNNHYEAVMQIITFDIEHYVQDEHEETKHP